MGIYRNNPSGLPKQAAYPNLAPLPPSYFVVILVTAAPNSTGVLFTLATGPSTKVTALNFCLNSFSYG